jgi:hypothetical protein
MDLALQNLKNVARAIGRGVVMYADKWEIGEALALTHLGDTEGDIVVTPNAEVAAMTLPELSGPAPVAADYVGEAPTIELPLFLADPDLAAIISPSGLGNAGRTLRRPVKEYTLAIFPEELFVVEVDGQAVRVPVAYVDGAWTVNEVAATPAQLALIANSIWCWRGYFDRPVRTYHAGAGDAKKAIIPSTFHLMQHPDLPEGQQLYTLGDPIDSDVDVEGMS